jgi:hypothetical protein
MTKSLAALVTCLAVTATLAAQVPVGNQDTFGRSYPFLNRHAYSTQTDAGRSFPFLNRHAYSTQVDQGRPIPGRAPRQVGNPAPQGPQFPPNAPQQPGAAEFPYGFPGYVPGYPVVPGYLGNYWGPYFDPFGMYFYRWPGMGWFPPMIPAVPAGNGFTPGGSQ